MEGGNAINMCVCVVPPRFLFYNSLSENVVIIIKGGEGVRGTKNPPLELFFLYFTSLKN
jgi:hypothetical protein